MDDLALIDEIVRRADEHQKQKEREFAIAELEKIKSNINCKYLNNYKYSAVTVAYILNDLDNRIKELKGENNIKEKEESDVLSNS